MSSYINLGYSRNDDDDDRIDTIVSFNQSYLDWDKIISKIYGKLVIRHTSHEFRDDVREIESIDGIQLKLPLSVECLKCQNHVEEQSEWDSEFKLARTHMIELYNQE